MAAPFDDPSMNAEEFRAALEYAIVTRYDGTWTFLAETKLGFIPAGILFAFWPGKVKELQPHMIIGDLAWFPWASSRNKIESAVNFFSKIRNEIPMIDYAYGETNKRFFTTVAKHGVMRRVGTTFNVKHGEPVAIFETRTG
jgi:hypothetical protein